MSVSYILPARESERLMARAWRSAPASLECPPPSAAVPPAFFATFPDPDSTTRNFVPRLRTTTGIEALLELTPAIFLELVGRGLAFVELVLDEATQGEGTPDAERRGHEPEKHVRPGEHRGSVASPGTARYSGGSSATFALWSSIHFTSFDRIARDWVIQDLIAWRFSARAP